MLPDPPPPLNPPLTFCVVRVFFTWRSGGAGRRLPGQTRAGSGRRRLARSERERGAGGEKNERGARRAKKPAPSSAPAKKERGPRRSRRVAGPPSTPVPPDQVYRLGGCPTRPGRTWAPRRGVRPRRQGRAGVRVGGRAVESARPAQPNTRRQRAALPGPSDPGDRTRGCAINPSTQTGGKTGARVGRPAWAGVRGAVSLALSRARARGHRVGEVATFLPPSRPPPAREGRGERGGRASASRGGGRQGAPPHGQCLLPSSRAPRARGGGGPPRARKKQNKTKRAAPRLPFLSFSHLLGEQGVAFPQVVAELVEGVRAGQACSGEEG